jgi:prepilin-type N-terminal cleavage/methylation domain-containing protein
MRQRAFTLIELLVVIAIIAILAAILFPVFTQAKVAAKKTQALSQMKQLGMAVMMYASDYDDRFVPASNRGLPASDPGRVWPPLILPYTKDKQIFIAPESRGSFVESWNNRNEGSIGMNESSGYDPNGCQDGQQDMTGCEGFTSVLTLTQMDEPSRTGLFAVTPNGPMNLKYRGHVFNPYNGPADAQDPRLGVPWCSDNDFVLERQDLPPAQLKPIYARYGRTGRGEGVTPVIFGDGSAKNFSANRINRGRAIIWRYR